MRIVKLNITTEDLENIGSLSTDVENLSNSVSSLSDTVGDLAADVSELNNGTVKKSNTSNTLYGKNGQGAEDNIYYSSDYQNKGWQVVIRDGNSDVLVPNTPTSNNGATSKQYVDNISSVIPPSASSTNQLLTIDEGQSLLQPEFIGSVTTASINIPGVSNYNGAEFNLRVHPKELNGLYVFTFGNAMNLIPIYGITSNTQYKISGMINNGDDSFSNVVLSYNYTGQKLQFYCVQHPIPTGYTAFLYKIKLY